MILDFAREIKEFRRTCSLIYGAIRSMLFIRSRYQVNTDGEREETLVNGKECGNGPERQRRVLSKVADKQTARQAGGGVYY